MEIITDYIKLSESNHRRYGVLPVKSSNLYERDKLYRLLTTGIIINVVCIMDNGVFLFRFVQGDTSLLTIRQRKGLSWVQFIFKIARPMILE